MWVKKKPAEVVEARRLRKRDRVKSAVFIGMFVTVLTTCVMGWREAADRGHFLVALAAIPRRLPASLFFGVISGLLYHRFGSRKPIGVCAKCGAVGYTADSARCSCGGEFKDIEDMKWK